LGSIGDPLPFVFLALAYRSVFDSQGTLIVQESEDLI
jgi:hypothetical protein